MEKKLVSVIIPTFKRPDFLVRAVDSVLNQTYENIEVIVCDDNSSGTEGRIATEKVMEKYFGDKRVIYCRHKQNMNGSVARNTGIRASNGEFLAFLDDDDEMLDNRIEKLVARLEKLGDEWGACYSDFKKLMPDGRFQVCGEKREGNLYREALMRSLYFCPGSNLIVRSSLAKQIGGFDEDFRRNQDMEFLARILKITKIAYVDECTLIIHYELHVHEKRQSYDDLVAVDEFYLKKFEGDIADLSERDRKKIISYFALERLRYSLPRKKLGDALVNCRKNKIGIVICFRYVFYCIYRVITKKSVGFRI